MNDQIAYDIVPWNPVDIMVTVCRNSVVSIRFLPHGDEPTLAISRDTTQVEFATSQIKEYLSGRRQTFDLSLAMQGSPFQLKVWDQLIDIPYGGTLSYGDVARNMGRFGAARAVGGAVRRNQLPILVPCHRIVATDGIGGFTGGLEIKRALFEIEGITENKPQVS